MVAVAIPVVTAIRAGATVATEVVGDTVNGHSVVNSGKTIVQIHNTGGSTYTATFVPTATTGGLAIASVVISVVAGATVLCSDFDTSIFSQTLGFTVSNAALKMLAYDND